ncbi:MULTISPECIES: BatD family protein [unclassified Vibrio]|uniref:BatD family protein n=1 Tax=Vibrio sp. HB236076 TaxID=3232307 RepID=A0AB39HLG4_9VIBR|nr:BatD family protein [Vibrio sp. HB161653]MDP5252638.1 BatD family protein [Vibrio sp. HB161653]
MKINLCNVFFFTLFGLFTCPLFAAPVASVSKTQVVKNELIQLTIRDDDIHDSDDLDLSPLRARFVVGQPHYSTSRNIINGQYSSQSEWVISLATSETGQVVIPALKVANQVTQPITLSVSASPTTLKASQFIASDVKVADTTLYPQQSTRVQVKLIIKADTRRIENPSITPPTIEGMTLTPLGKSRQYQAVVEGINATVVEQNFELTAEKAGTYQLIGPAFNGTYYYHAINANRTQVLSLQTQGTQTAITVSPIPNQTDGDWLPAHHLVLDQQWQDSDGQTIKEPAAVKVGDAITRTLTLSLSGLKPEQFPSLDINYGNDVRVYKNKPQFNTDEQGRTTMTVKHVLIPTQQGQVSLPAWSLNWWDTDSNQSQTSQVAGLTLTIKEANTPPAHSETVQTGKSLNTAGSRDMQGVSAFWQYAALSSWAAWIISAGYFIWYRKRRSTPSTSAHDNEPMGNEEKANAPMIPGIKKRVKLSRDPLAEMIKTGNAANIQFHLAKWLKTQPLSDTTKQQITQELQVMMKAHYHPQGGNWQPDHLLTLYRQAKKEQPTKAAPLLARL